MNAGVGPGAREHSTEGAAVLDRRDGGVDAHDSGEVSAHDVLEVRLGETLRKMVYITAGFGKSFGVRKV